MKKVTNKLDYYASLFQDKKILTNQSSKIQQYINDYKKTPGNKLLILSTGDGTIVNNYKDNFYITGLENSKSLLDKASILHPDISFLNKDFLGYNTKVRYDIILGNNEYISSLKDSKKLELFFDKCSNLLNSGGLLILQPSYLKSRLPKSNYSVQSTTIDKSNLIKISYTTSKQSKLILENRYIIVNNDGINTIVDKKELNLLDSKQVIKLLDQYGFKSHYIKDGLGKYDDLFIGIRI